MAGKLIVLFAKAPTPGRVKTRLLSVLDPELASELHSAFVLDMTARFRNLDEAEFELHTDTCTDAWKSLDVTRKVQISGDLGLKMIHALKQGMVEGSDRVLVLGSDAPTLPLSHVQELLASTKDVALGPTADGGFYGISARRTHPAMFNGVGWSQSETLAQTLDAIRRCELSIEIGPSWFDVDEPQDLELLAKDPHLPLNTAVCLQSFKGRRDTD